MLELLKSYGWIILVLSMVSLSSNLLVTTFLSLMQGSHMRMERNEGKGNFLWKIDRFSNQIH